MGEEIAMFMGKEKHDEDAEDCGPNGTMLGWFYSVTMYPSTD